MGFCGDKPTPRMERIFRVAADGPKVFGKVQRELVRIAA
jgi:hypothetical protein